METYTLGKTDLEVTPIGLGCWQFSQGRGLVGKYWGDLPQDSVNEIVRVSLERGINWFDTAEIYGKGASERSLAAALQTVGVERESYLIADKWFPAFRFAGSIGKTFPRREAALGGRSVDLYQIHQPLSFSSVEKQMDEMVALIQDGRIRAVGISNFNEKRMRAAATRLAEGGIPLASNQMLYSLIDRQIERNGVLDAAKELGVSIIAYSPLAQGILSGKFHGEVDIQSKSGPRKHMKRFKPDGLQATQPLVDVLHRVGEVHNATPAQLALAWVVQRHDRLVVAIPGASSVQQAESNADALQIRLSGPELDELSEAGLEAERALKG